MSSSERKHLRVLIANERKDRLALVAPIVVALGHEVIAREIEVEDVGEITAAERPDVALVGLGRSTQHALDLIDRIVHEAACPVIVLLHARDPEFINEASKRGVFAHINDADVDDWQSSIDIVLRRFAEYQDLQGAFGRRTMIERAKGILMERHGISGDAAFELLRDALAHRQPQAHGSGDRGGRRPPPPAQAALRPTRPSPGARRCLGDKPRPAPTWR